MTTDEKWEIVHAHTRRVRRGLAEPLTCTTDGNELVPVVDHDLSPALKCLACKAVLHLGLFDLEKMKG